MKLSEAAGAARVAAAAAVWAGVDMLGRGQRRGNEAVGAAKLLPHHNTMTASMGTHQATAI